MAHLPCARPRTPRSCFRRQIKQVAFAMLLVAVSNYGCAKPVFCVGKNPTVASPGAGVARGHGARKKQECGMRIGGERPPKKTKGIPSARRRRVGAGTRKLPQTIG